MGAVFEPAGEKTKESKTKKLIFEFLNTMHHQSSDTAAYHTAVATMAAGFSPTQRGIKTGPQQ